MLEVQTSTTDEHGDPKTVKQHGKISLIDLAGSERLRKSYDSNPTRGQLQEGTHLLLP